MFYLFPKIWRSFNKIERLLLSGFFLALFLSGIFIITSIYYGLTIEKPLIGGVYREGLVGQPTFINPLVASNNDVDRDLAEIIYSDLDKLVKNYQVSQDNRSWTITLKDNLLWDDNEPVTSDDVIFTFDIIQDPANNHPLFQTWRGVVVERLNSNEFRLTLKTPYVFLIDNLKEIKIAPRHIFKNIPPTNFRLSRYNLEPVGNGPYKFQAFKNKRDGFITEYELVRNKNYSGKSPFIDKIIFKFYEDNGALVNAFNQKEVDAIAGLSPQIASQLKINTKILTINLPRYYAIFFNSNIHPALKDDRVREALTIAVNKDKITKEIFDDQTIIMNGPLPPNIAGYDQSLFKNDKFDLTAAENLLNKTKWTKNEKGVRMEINVVTPQIPFLINTIELIKKDWEKIGVQLNPIILEPNDVNNTVIKTRNYEAIIFGNILRKNQDLFSFWHSTERFYPGGNLALYANKKVDSLLESIRQDFDSNSRKQKIGHLQKIIEDDKPAIFLFSPNYLYAVPKNLGGFHSYFISTPSNRFEKIEEWFLKTGRVKLNK